MTTRRFSGYLRELLEQKGMTVSGLARLSGVERTALSKVLAGQRVLPYGALDGLIYYLRLTPDEEGRLRESYDAQFEKEGVRRSRAMVGKLFSDLAELDFAPPAFEESRLLLDLEGYAGQRSIFYRYHQRPALAADGALPGAHPAGRPGGADGTAYRRFSGGRAAAPVSGRTHGGGGEPDHRL